MDELKQVVHAALKAFYRLGTKKCRSFDGTGLVEIDDTLNVYSMVDFHDEIANEPWPEQCRIITDRCGPTQHSIVLMALAWLTYDGWVRYLQEHKHAPVNVQQYLMDGMTADDIRSVLGKEY